MADAKVRHEAPFWSEQDLADIIENWEADFRDWFAVDALDPKSGAIRRLYVGDCGRAKEIAAARISDRDWFDGEGELDLPGGYSEYLETGSEFYRATPISVKEARDYFLGRFVEVTDLGPGYAEKDIDELVSATQAALELGITRQSARELIRSGRLAASLFAGEYRVARYSVELRNAAKRRRSLEDLEGAAS